MSSADREFESHTVRTLFVSLKVAKNSEWYFHGHFWFSKIDILVQNAAIGMKPRSLVDTSEELFDKIFSINVKVLEICKSIYLE